MRKNSSAYPVEFVADAFGESSALADVLEPFERVLIVADQNVVNRVPGIGARIGRYVQDHELSLAAKPVVFPGGERAKTDDLQSALTVVSAILDAKVGRGDVVLAIGGGAVLDVAGYAAAQTRGGLGVVRMPTTPSAMMDAAFADYAAVDSFAVKDALRVPSEPAAVVVDTTLADTVLDGVWCSGIGAAVRLAVANDASLLSKVEELAPDYEGRREGALDELVRLVHATRAKKGATALGLWAANRLEPMSGYKVPYGYATVIGLMLEVGAAVVRGDLGDDDIVRIRKIFRDCGAIGPISRSVHLVKQVESLMYGLDAWLLSSPDGVPAISKIGKSELVVEPDRDAYRAAAESFARTFISPPPEA